MSQVILDLNTMGGRRVESYACIARTPPWLPYDHQAASRSNTRTEKQVAALIDRQGSGLVHV